MDFALIILLSFVPAVSYETILKNNQNKKMNEFQQYNLLLALALNAQTRATHFDTHGVTDSLIDLEYFSLINSDTKLYQMVESLNKLSQTYILNLIISTAQNLKNRRKKSHK
ncbi:hypothetical protein L8106_22316 [Lyngbya sp. PCC 8106]|nr:hypothetical protein L8106_22316 [Lyngbya sp. PCC 8106]